MSTDTVRLHYTYAIAILILVGGFYLLITAIPDVTGGEKLAFIGSIMGGVILFVFNRESSAGQAPATARAVAQGAASQAPAQAAAATAAAADDEEQRRRAAAAAALDAK
jgi:hypothetical protein